MTTTGHANVPGYLLDRFAERVVGCRAVVAVSSEGLPIATSETLGGDGSVILSAITAGAVALTAGVADHYGTGGLELVIFRMEHGSLLVNTVNDRVLLAVLAERSADISQVGYELALLARSIGDVLTPAGR